MNQIKKHLNKFRTLRSKNERKPLEIFLFNDMFLYRYIITFEGI